MEATLKIKLPGLPNYLIICDERLNRDDCSIDIADVPDSELNAIGQEWVSALLKKASERRDARKK